MKCSSSSCLVALCLIFIIGTTKASSSKYSLPASDSGSIGMIPNADSKLQERPFSFDDEDDAYEKLRTFSANSSDGNDNPFRGKRLYNTSIALTASFFSFYLPQRTQPGTVTDLVNQAIYGLFGTLAVILIYAVPVLFTGIRSSMKRSNGRSNDLDEEDSWISSPFMKIDQIKRVFDEDLRDQIGLDSTKCLQKTICEAHRSPKNKKYGLLVLPFQMFFPPAAETSKGRATSYQLAAQEGKYGETDCAKNYKCFFDTLDLSTFLIDWYRLTNDPDYVPKDADFY